MHCLAGTQATWPSSPVPCNHDFAQEGSSGWAGSIFSSKFLKWGSLGIPMREVSLYLCGAPHTPSQSNHQAAREWSGILSAANPWYCRQYDFSC